MPKRLPVQIDQLPSVSWVDDSVWTALERYMYLHALSVTPVIPDYTMVVVDGLLKPHLDLPTEDRTQIWRSLKASDQAIFEFLMSTVPDFLDRYESNIDQRGTLIEARVGFQLCGR